jgi:hypothetical protein
MAIYHSFEGALMDLLDMRPLSRPGGVVIMDDLWCAAWWCKAPTAAWQQAIKQRLLTQTGCEVLG